MTQSSIRVCLLTLTVLSLLTGCADSSRLRDRFSGEQLITPYYADLDNWSTEDRTGPGFSERVWRSPNNEKIDAYAITVTYLKSSSLAQMRAQADRVGEQACDEFSSERLTFPNKSLFPLLYWQTACENKHTVSKLLHLMIEGNEATYYLQKSWQMDINAEELLRWKQRFESVYLCDNRLQVDSCPAIRRTLD